GPQDHQVHRQGKPVRRVQERAGQLPEEQGRMRRAAVLGSPVAHSLSPVLHRSAYAEMGLTGWSYEAVECAEDGLAGFLDGLDGDWAGLSLTMPLKRTVLKLADECSDLALAVGGANTLLLHDGRRLAENTDVYGAIKALTEAGLAPPPG